MLSFLGCLIYRFCPRLLGDEVQLVFLHGCFADLENSLYLSWLLGSKSNFGGFAAYFEVVANSTEAVLHNHFKPCSLVAVSGE